MSPERGQSQSSGKVKLEKRDYAIGIGLLLVVVFLWTSSNFLTQDLYQDGYEKPFLVTYLNTSAFALYLFPFYVRRFFSRRSEKGSGLSTEVAREEYEPLANEPEQVDHSTITHPPDSYEHLEDPPTDELLPLTTQETAQLAFAFCFIWFIANWTVNASLNLTSVASATILSSTSGFFTLGIGRVFHVETLTLAKVGAVMTSFAGVILVALSDSSQSLPPETQPTNPSLLAIMYDNVSKPIFGDALALLSAVFYAIYVILLKVRIRSEARIDMQQFFGFVGLFNIICCWPMGVLLHLTGVEILELPTTQKAVAALLINMAITLSSDYIYVLAMLKTTPLVVTVGLSLTLPLAVVGDFFLSKPPKGLVIVGAVLVILGFVVVGADDADMRRKETVSSGASIHLAREEVDLET